MRINPINMNYNGQNYKNKPAFKAVLLKDNIIFVDKMTHSPINGAIVELETETRELVADARRRHEHDISEEEYQKRLNFWHDRIAIMDFLSRDKVSHERDLYMGDYKLMEDLAKYTSLPYAKEINERVKKNDMYNSDLTTTDYTSTKAYWNAVTAGKTKLSPNWYEGLLDSELYRYLTRTGDGSLDSIIPGTANESYVSAPRQRILLAVESRKDGNYRNIPDSKVYGIAEIYTDRAMDVVEEMATDEIDAEKELIGNVSLSQEEIGKYIMRLAKIPESRVNPLEIYLLGSFRYLKGVGKALIEAACEKGKFCGVLANMSKLSEYNKFYSNGFRHIKGNAGNKLLKPGHLKTRFVV